MMNLRSRELSLMNGLMSLMRRSKIRTVGASDGSAWPLTESVVLPSVGAVL